MPYEKVPGRSCGGCTACCKTHGIAEFAKGNGEWCKKCTVNVGCSIHNQIGFPLECAEYKCFWLAGKGDEGDRPDKLKIVMDGEEFSVGTYATGIWNMWEVESGARLQPRVTQLTQTITSQGIVVRHYELLGINNLKEHFFTPPNMSKTLFKKFKRVLTDIDHAHTLIHSPPRII